MPAVLTSWKEIAAHLGKSIRTVQRWERELALPVRRPDLRRSGIVLADPAELDAWLHRQGTLALEPREEANRVLASRFQDLHQRSALTIERTLLLYQKLGSEVATLHGRVRRHHDMMLAMKESAALRKAAQETKGQPAA